MVLGEAAALIAPPNDVVNENVAGTLCWPATRKAESMVNEIETTAVGEGGGVELQSVYDQIHVDKDWSHCPSSE